MNDGVTIAIPGADKPVKPEDIVKEKTGIELNFTQALADTIVSQYMTTLGEDVLKNTFQAMNEEYISNHLADPANFKFAMKKEVSNYYGNTKYETTKLGEVVDRLIAETYGNAIVDFVKEYIQTDDFKARLKAMADEVVQYALEGYKNDIINRLRERLVGNVLTSTLWENGRSVDEVIAETVSRAMQNHVNYDHQRNGY